MLARLNTSTEVSLLPTGLGNHYTSNSRHLIPPGRRRLPYNHSVSSASDCYIGDPNAPEARMSFREHQERFGPDVLVIAGLSMACAGAALTLVSSYCRFRHPAIQATVAGIGPALVGVGLLFCALRLFFCSFCVRRTCCECIADGLRFIAARCQCSRHFGKIKKQIHPLQVKDIVSVTNGQPAAAKVLTGAKSPIKEANNVFTHGAGKRNGNAVLPAIEMTALRMEPIHEAEEKKTMTPEVTEEMSPREEKKQKEEEDILKDEIDLLDEIKSQKTNSPQSEKSLKESIDELVLKTPRY